MKKSIVVGAFLAGVVVGDYLVYRLLTTDDLDRLKQRAERRKTQDVEVQLPGKMASDLVKDYLTFTSSAGNTASAFTTGEWR